MARLWHADNKMPFLLISFEKKKDLIFDFVQKLHVQETLFLESVKFPICLEALP